MGDLPPPLRPPQNEPLKILRRLGLNHSVENWRNILNI